MSKNIQIKNKNASPQFPILSFLAKRPNLIRNAVTAHAILLFCIHITMQLAFQQKPAAVAEIRDPLQIVSNFQAVIKQTLSLAPPALLNKIPSVPNMWTPPPPQKENAWIESIVQKQMMETVMSYSSLLHGSQYYQAFSTISAEYTKYEHYIEIYKFCVMLVTSMFRDMKKFEESKGQGKPPMFKWFSNMLAIRAPKVPNMEVIYAVLHMIGFIVSITYTWKAFFETGGVSRFEYFYKYFTYLAIFRMFMSTFKTRVLKRNRNNNRRFEEINNRNNRNRNNRRAAKRLMINYRKNNGRNNRALVTRT